jgi:predicted transcriptional regulator
LKKFRVRDILSHDFFTLRGDTPLAKVLELIFRSRQEDFPVVDSGSLKGFATRQDIISGIHRMGMDIPVSDIMRKDFPVVQESDPLVKAQGAMQENGLTALPVMRGGDVIGVITLEDIGRIYAMASRGA